MHSTCKGTVNTKTVSTGTGEGCTVQYESTCKESVDTFEEKIDSRGQQKCGQCDSIHSPQHILD